MASVMQESAVWVPETRSFKKGKDAKIEQWWEVKRAQNPADQKLTRGATPLVERCMRVHGFSEAFAIRVLKGYRQFMELKTVMNDWNETKLAPSVPINQMWEQHLLDNLNYAEDCLVLFGRVIGHNPDAVLEGEDLQIKITTTKIAFQARYIDDLDEDVWDYGDNWNKECLKQDETPNSIMGHRPVSVSRGRSSISSPKPTSPTGSNEPITIFLRDQESGEETYFSLRYKSTLRIVFTVFAERRGLNQDALKFSFNGQELTGYETPHSLNLDDRAKIDVLIKA